MMGERKHSLICCLRCRLKETSPTRISVKRSILSCLKGMTLLPLVWVGHCGVYLVIQIFRRRFTMKWMISSARQIVVVQTKT
ncbi:hypothetical protein COOONC_26461 [Cooperia oncophora]